ncbi:MAG: MmgE/PrpD family protein [Lautropia sp.]
MGVTAVLAERAAVDRSGCDDPGLIRRVGHSLLDWLACAIAGVDEPASRRFADFVAAQGARGIATVVGTTARTSPLLAAQANGLISHALDFDDANLTMPGHPGIVLFPGLLALAEQQRSSGLQLAQAFLAGYDAGCRIGALVAPGH